MRIGPASVYCPVSGAVEVRHDDVVVGRFGSDSRASAFAEGYNKAYWRVMDGLPDLIRGAAYAWDGDALVTKFHVDDFIQHLKGEIDAHSS